MPNNASQQHKQYKNKDSRKCLQVKITFCVALIASLNHKQKGVGEMGSTLKYDKGIALRVDVRNFNLDSP